MSGGADVQRDADGRGDLAAVAAPTVVAAPRIGARAFLADAPLDDRRLPRESADRARICGELIASVPSNSSGSEKEFQAWAKAHEPDEYAHLRPDGRIDPTGDRAARTRALLERWRKATGRPVLVD